MISDCCVHPCNHATPLVLEGECDEATTCFQLRDIFHRGYTSLCSLGSLRHEANPCFARESLHHGRNNRGIAGRTPLRQCLQNACVSERGNAATSRSPVSPILAVLEMNHPSVPANCAASLALSCVLKTPAIWFMRCGASIQNRSWWSPSKATPASTPAQSAPTAAIEISSHVAASRFQSCGRERLILFVRK